MVARKSTRAEVCEECRARLPNHLAEIAGDRFTHVCSCGAAYKVKDGKFVRAGRKYNPFTGAR